MSGEEATQLAVRTFKVFCFFLFFVGEGRSELVLSRDSVWPSTASCYSQGVWRRLSHQAPAAHSTTSPFCDQCAAWTDNAGWIHNLRRTRRSLSKGRPALWVSVCELRRWRYRRKRCRTSVPVCACRIAIAVQPLQSLKSKTELRVVVELWKCQPTLLTGGARCTYLAVLLSTSLAPLNCLFFFKCGLLKFPGAVHGA